LGMTIWPFEVTFDLAVRIVPILLAVAVFFLYQMNLKHEVRHCQVFCLTIYFAKIWKPKEQGNEWSQV